MVTVQMTPFQAHCEKWKNGCGADECASATRIVLARGNIPCGVLLVGEAPGHSEDALGFPFKGPAGIEQDNLLRTVNARTGGALYRAGVGFCNLVGCLPYDMLDGGKASEPLPEQVKQCRPRLEEFIRICQPTIVVAVGKLPESYLDSGLRDSVKLPPCVKDVITVTHPAAMLRAKSAQKSSMQQHYIAAITTVVLRYFGDH